MIISVDDKDNLLDTMHFTLHKLEGGLLAKGLFNKKSRLDMPLVSIIAVVLNGERYLEQTIQSVVNQTYDNIEYIVIDGACTDGTLGIIRKYEDKVCLVVFGASHSKDIENFAFEVKFVGRLYDDFSLALSYSAADVFVTSSVQDNLPNTVMESLSCGTSVAGLNTGGIPDMVDHKINGYLAEYKDPESLAEGIQWILEDENRVLKLRKAARKKLWKNIH